MSGKGFRSLMDFVCIDCGFCGCIKDGKPSTISNYIPSTGLVTADQFAEWVLIAENGGPDPEADSGEKFKRFKALFSAAFIEHMGANTVDARALRDVA